jgi:hypothetical protein
VFWTGTTKTGCIGQFKDCFIESSKESIFEGTIVPSDIGGSCVAAIRYGDRFIAKIKPCESKAYLACQGTITVEKATMMTYVIIYFYFFGLKGAFPSLNHRCVWSDGVERLCLTSRRS